MQDREHALRLGAAYRIKEIIEQLNRAIDDAQVKGAIVSQLDNKGRWKLTSGVQFRVTSTLMEV